MDADKLNEAAEKYFKEESAFRPPCLCKGFVFDAFLAGAQWLMTQPLAYRLTEEEKAGLMADFNRCKLLANKDYRDGRIVTYANIFGNDLFNEK